MPGLFDQLQDEWNRSQQGQQNAAYAATNPAPLQYGDPAANPNTVNNLAQGDPWYNFYNPLDSQTPGDNWFGADDRNNPMLNGTVPQNAPATIAQQSTPLGAQPQVAANSSNAAAPSWTGTIAPQTAAPALGAPAASAAPTYQNIAPLNIPRMSLDTGNFDTYMNQLGAQVKGAYDYTTPQAQASLLDTSKIPQVTAQQQSISPELQRMLKGEGYAPEILAKMRATAIEQPASAGLQQLSQMKRALGQAGIQGGAAAAMQGAIARQTGQDQNKAMRDVDIQNAQTGVENSRFGVGQQTGIGQSNMQAANTMALQNAGMMFDALRQNQNSSNAMSQFNTGLKADQQGQKANTYSNFIGQQGAQSQNQKFDKEKINAGFAADEATKPWDANNSFISQDKNILGQWGSY